MPAHLPATRHSLGRTFVVAAVVLGLVGAAQIGAVCWKFFQVPTAALAGNDDVRRPPAHIDVQKLMAEMPPPPSTVQPDDPLPFSSDPLDVEPVAVGPTGIRPVPIATPVDPRSLSLDPPPTPRADLVAPPMPRTFQPRPTPVPLVALTPKVSPQFTELIEQGKLLRNSGDTAGALVKFREASSMEPGNAQAMAEQAYTFEKMSLFDKAAEQWRRVLAMGENAGVLYSAARSKLDMAMAETMRTVSPSGGPQSVEAGKILGLDVPHRQEEPGFAGSKKFVLHVPIRAKAGEKVNVGDVTAVVLFYDRLDGKDIAQTTANTTYRWSAPPPNWADGDTETVEVVYELPPSVGRGDNREYYGYIARLYYKNELQDIHAEPAALSQQFPASPTLSE